MKSDTEIAKELGLSRGRVWQLRMRAEKKLREAILSDMELKRYLRDSGMCEEENGGQGANR